MNRCARNAKLLYIKSSLILYLNASAIRLESAKREKDFCEMRDRLDFTAFLSFQARNRRGALERVQSQRRDMLVDRNLGRRPKPIGPKISRSTGRYADVSIRFAYYTVSKHGFVKTYSIVS